MSFIKEQHRQKREKEKEGKDLKKNSRIYIHDVNIEMCVPETHV
jgi:hypothetical protein